MKKTKQWVMIATRSYDVVRYWEDTIGEGSGKWNPDTNEWFIYFHIRYRTRIGKWLIIHLIRECTARIEKEKS